jgi:sugar lactone lactonase YvrE
MKRGELFLLIFWLLTVTNCTKPDPPSPPIEETLAITAISPTHGPFGTVDTIYGTAFNDTASKNLVFFNGKPVTIVSATSNQIIVNVPKLVGTGPVSVTVNGVTAMGPVFKYDTVVYVSTLAGSGTPAIVDGKGTAASFKGPTGIEVDLNGNLYVIETQSCAVRKITPDGNVTTFAGVSATPGYIDAQGQNARFGVPHGMGIDKHGNIYVSDYLYVRKITPAAVVSTIAGLNQWGDTDGPVSIATFKNPDGVCVDTDGNIYVADQGSNKIRKISTAGIVSTIAGNGDPFNLSNGPALSAGFTNPVDVDIDNSTGAIFVCDNGAHRIRKIFGGNVSSFAGGTGPGNVDGVGTVAKFEYPGGLCTDKNGNVFVADFSNDKIRKITPSAVVTTYAGGGAGTVDGPVPYASFRGTGNVAVDTAGNLYICDYFNNLIRKATFQ